MSAGRTTWYSEDAALHRRELVIELRDEHGGGAVNVYRTLRDISQEQLGADLAGSILTGYRSLATAAGVDVDDCREHVAAMVEIGLLDDFEPREDGRRFTCRVSGWKADQSRGGETIRKRNQRAQTAPDASQDDDGDRDVSQLDGTSPPNQPLPDQPRPGKTETALTYRGKRVPADTASAAERLLALFNAEAGRDLTAGPHLRQIAGALLERSDVPVERWENAVRNTIANPPGWINGPVQLGHIFGERAADHALANTGGRGAGATSSAAGTTLVRELLPGVPVEEAAFAIDQAIRANGGKTDRDQIAAHIRRWFPDLAGELAQEPAAA